MTIHKIALRPSRYAQPTTLFPEVSPYDQDTWEMGDALSGVDILVQNRYQNRDGSKRRHSLHFAGNDNAHRRVQYGPVMQGAYAFLTPHPTVVALHPIKPLDHIEVEIGDVLMDENLGVILKIVDGGTWDNTKVQVLEAPAATVDHSEWVEKTNAEAAARR